MAEISNRDELEHLFGTKVLSLTRQQRNRLIALLGKPPNPANVPDSFWLGVGREMYSRVIVILAMISQKSANEHGLESEQASLIASQWADAHAREMIAGWVDRSQAILKNHSDRWAESPAPPTAADAAETADTIFGPDRVARMASTETTTAQTAGAERAVAAAGGTSPNDLWFTREDGKVCSVCRPLHETPRSFWAQFVPAGPPAHPDCRCYLLYENLGEIRK